MAQSNAVIMAVSKDARGMIASGMMAVATAHRKILNHAPRGCQVIAIRVCLVIGPVTDSTTCVNATGLTGS